jgi:uncharacterized protein YfaS (alpha-2-macroglobulin family)
MRRPACSLLCSLLLAALGACSGKSKPPDPGTGAPPALPRRAAGPGFQLQLEEAPASGDAARARLLPAATLPEAEAQALLARLKPIAVEAGDKKEFALRGRSMPPPRTGATVQTPFPPPVRPPAPDPGEAGPLAVLRFAPEGDLPLASNLSVTFSQPMVAVTSHADSVAKGVPVKLTPVVDGKWRWVGTKTLLFESAARCKEGDSECARSARSARFPMATEFKAEVPAGTASATGGKLAAAKSWSFRTPPPRLLQHHPSGGPQRLDPILYLGFDQRVDPKAVLRTLRFEGGGKEIGLALATSAELAQDEGAAALAQTGEPERFLTLKPKGILAPATSYTLSVGPGTPSAEGPLTTKDTQTFVFTTYEPLKVTNKSCSYSKCTPLQAIYLSFNNPLDEELFDPKAVKVSPAIPEMRVEASGYGITIHGSTKGSTTYHVTLPAKLADVYGQKLGSSTVESFPFGTASPRLYSGAGDFVVLDPAGEKSFGVYSINHSELEVKLYAVGPEDWSAYQTFAREGMRRELSPATPPGKLRHQRLLRPSGGSDELSETRIDLKPALSGGFGQVLVLVTQRPLPAKPYERQYVLSWVQVTELAVDAIADGKDLLAWVSRLSDGKPVAGAKAKLHPEGTSAATDATGLALLAPPASHDRARVLAARLGQDLVVLPESRYYWGGGGGWARRTEPGPTLRWYLFDDRKLYKPKEEVKVKGWLRLLDLGRGGGIRGLPASGTSVSYEVRESRGNKVAEGKATVGALGGFDFAFKLPDTVNLGHANITLRASGSGASSGETQYHGFRVEEFRRPEFEVSSNVSEGPHFLGGHADVAVTASYFAGGALPGAEVSWQVTASPGHFTPPNQSEYSFGSSRPLYGHDDDEGGYRGRYRRGVRVVRGDPGPKPQSFAGRTDGRGAHRLRVHFLEGKGQAGSRSEKKPKTEEEGISRPMSVTAVATVQDVNRQSWTTTSHVLVHAARHYVGLRSPRAFVERGQPLKIEVVVADLDGKLVPGRSVAVRATRLEWRRERGRGYREIEVEPQSCAITSGAKPEPCSFKTEKGGSYLISATTRDGENRLSRTDVTTWVSGGEYRSQQRVQAEEVKLVADRPSYQPGERARILVQPPFAPAEALLTVRRVGMLEKRRFRIEGSTATIEVAIKEEHIPNLTVQVDVVGAARRKNELGEVDEKLPARPAHASGTLGLSVPPLKKKLALEVKPAQARLEPGAETSIEVIVRDASQKPVAGSEVAVVVVDEAVLALTGYRLHDPLPVFYPYRGPGVSDTRLRPSVYLADPLALRQKQTTEHTQHTQRESAPGDRFRGASGGRPPPAPSAVASRAPAEESAKSVRHKGEEGRMADKRDGHAPDQIQVRKDFSALALFAPAVQTDAEGRARVQLKLPDNLTRYRIMAVAVASDRFFGQGEATVTARNPLMVRPSAPRFLNFGDRFELPVVIQNQTDAPLAVSVAVRVSNLTLTAGSGRRLTVPANDRVEVRFPSAAADPGTARIQIAAAAGKWSDAAELELPVWTPATTEAFATYGTVDKGATVQPVKLPKDIVLGFGGLEVGTSSTELQALTDAVLYLVSYPYECSEQLSSRVLAVAALKDVLSAFKAPRLPSSEAMIAAVDRDLRRLQGMQNHDGGFPLWERGRPSWPFLANHVTHALVRAKAKGFKVPDAMLQRAIAYLRSIESHIPSEWGPETRRAIVAYSLYVRALGGEPDVAKARALFAEFRREKVLPLEGVAWIYPVLSGSAEATAEIAELRRLLASRVSESAATAQFATAYGDSAYLIMYSDRRVDALLLEGLIKDQPKSDLIVKLVRGLLGHRKAGRWGSTQENAWVLLALDRYFNVYEKVTPNFVARAWLGDQFAGEHAFRGRSTERHQIEIPMKTIAEAGAKSDLILAKQGAGRMYYRIGMRYAPSDLRPPPASHGFTVERSYAAVDKPSDVQRGKDGSWVVKAGARVRVRLTMVAPARRYHVALVDPLPAGFEAISGSLLGAQSGGGAAEAAPTGPGYSGGYHRGFRGRVSGYPGGRYWGYWGQWYEHQNLRDERAEAFASLLWEGVHTYSYLARATTPGSFVVPPPKAEEMYHPETFGRGAGDRVIVE